MNRVSVRNANNPMPTGHGEAGTKLLSSFEDGFHVCTTIRGFKVGLIVTKMFFFNTNVLATLCQWILVHFDITIW